MLARVFQTLAQRKPGLDAGCTRTPRRPGPYAGFLRVRLLIGRAVLETLLYWVLMRSTSARSFPFFGDGNTLTAIAVASVGIWLFHFTILKGVRQAALNTIVTGGEDRAHPHVHRAADRRILDSGLFRANFWGGAEPRR